MFFVRKIFVILKKKVWWLLNLYKFRVLGVGSFVDSPLLITKVFISCGKNVHIGKFGRIEGIRFYNKEKFNPKIVIGDGVSIEQFIHLTCADSISIGNNTAIAANVTITDIHHPYTDITMPIEKQDIEVNAVRIGKNCKIYNNSVILPGTIIGNHCTIGANSVVSGHFNDYCVIVGTPAKIVKRYCFERKQWLKTKINGEFIN